MMGWVGLILFGIRVSQKDCTLHGGLGWAVRWGGVEVVASF